MSSQQNTSTQNPNNAPDFHFTTEYTFNNEPFSCQIYTANQNSVLVIQVESQKTFERWRGEFPAQSIEAVTQKTGNFKKFSVFVKMLYSSLTQKSETVTIDLLTRQQLELLFRKNRQTFQTKNTNQRYLILTYAVEFDRVHYPLPLSYEEPSVEQLKETIKMLRQRNNSDADVARLQQENIAFREEIDNLKIKLQEKSEMLKNNSSSNVEVDQLRIQIDRLKKERHQLKVSLERKKKESENEIQVMQHECDILAQDLKRQSEEMENMKRIIEARENDKSNPQLLKKKITKYKQELRQKNQELNDLHLQLDSLQAEARRAQRRTTATGSRTGSRAGSRNNSMRASPIGARPASGSASRRRSSTGGALGSTSKRFDPSEYVRQQQQKRQRLSQRKHSGATQSSSRNSSRRSSVELNGRPRSRLDSVERPRSRLRSVERPRSRISSVERRPPSSNRVLSNPLPRSSSRNRTGSVLRSRNSSRGVTPPRSYSRSPQGRQNHDLDPRLLKEKLDRLSKRSSRHQHDSYAYSSADEESISEPIRVIATKKRSKRNGATAVNGSADRRKIRTRLRERYDLDYDTDDSDVYDHRI